MEQAWSHIEMTALPNNAMQWTPQSHKRATKCHLKRDLEKEMWTKQVEKDGSTRQSWMQASGVWSVCCTGSNKAQVTSMTCSHSCRVQSCGSFSRKFIRNLKRWQLKMHCHSKPHLSRQSFSALITNPEARSALTYQISTNFPELQWDNS